MLFNLLEIACSAQESEVCDVLLQLLLKISYLYSHGYHRNRSDERLLGEELPIDTHLWPTSKKNREKWLKEEMCDIS